MSDWRPKPKVYTQYGFAEGRAIGKVLRRELREAGYINTRFKSRADVFIAHSGGCLLIPKKNNAKLIVLVDPPYWPGKRILTSWTEYMKRNFVHHKQVGTLKQLAIKSAHHGRYIVTRSMHTKRMHKAHKIQRFPEVKANQRIIVVRNQNDPFCSPTIAQELPQAKLYEFHEFPGEHDDIWHYPNKYIELINSVLK